MDSRKKPGDESPLTSGTTNQTRKSAGADGGAPPLVAQSPLVSATSFRPPSESDRRPPEEVKDPVSSEQKLQPIPSNPFRPASERGEKRSSTSNLLLSLAAPAPALRAASEGRLRNSARERREVEMRVPDTDRPSSPPADYLSETPQPSTDDHANYVPVNIDPPQQVNWGQKIGQVIYTYVVDAVPGAYVVAKAFPPVAEPYNSMLIALYASTSITVADALRAVTQEPHPFEHFNWRTASSYFVGQVASLGGGFALGYFVVPNLPKILPLDNLELLEFLLNPFTKFAATALVSQFAFGMTKLLMNCVLKNRQVVNHENEKTNKIQDALATLVNPLEPVVMYIALHDLLITLAKDAPLRNEFFPLVVAGLQQVLRGLNHLIRVPRPIDNLVPRKDWPKQDETSLAELGEADEGEVRLPPSKAQIFSALVRYTARSGLAISTGGLITLMMLAWWTGEKDQEKNSELVFLLRLYLIALSTYLAEPLLGTVQACGNLASHCWSNMWRKTDPATEPLLSEENLETHDDRDHLDSDELLRFTPA